MGGAGELSPWRGLDGLRRELADVGPFLAGLDVAAPCNDPAWLVAHAAAFGTEPFGVTWRDGGGVPRAFAALRREPRRAAFALRRATFAQDGTFDSDYLELALAPGFERAGLEHVLDALAADRTLDACVLACVPDDARWLPTLRSLLEARRLPRRERPVACAAATLPDSFDAYLAARKKRVRSKLRSSLRQAEQAGGVFAWCNDAASLERHLEGLFDLHGRRWRAAGEDGSFADERRRRFYLELLPTCLEHGSLRLSRLEQGGRPIAYQLGLVANSTYFQLQEGYDPELAATRPGTALRAWSIRELIAQGTRTYDFMAGHTRHKTDWGGEARACTTLAFALPRWRARLAYGLRRLLDRGSSDRR